MPSSPSLPKVETSRRRNQLIQIPLAALGLTSIYLFWLVQPAIEAEQYVFYHWKGSPTPFFVAIAADFVVAWILLTSLLLFARNPGRLRTALWSALLLLLPWAGYLNYRVVHSHIPYHRLSSVLFFAAVFATLAITALWRTELSLSFERIITSATEILLFAGLFGVFVLCKLAWYGWVESSLDDHTALHQRSSTAAVPPNRIIWIVFDELSYEQLYVHRFAGLQLPAFDALARESTVFTNAAPPDISTEIVLPGLLTGKAFDQVKPLARGQLSVRDAASHSWKRFDQHDTVFQDALTAGYSTAVSGWYNPYCRLIPQVLDQCFWSMQQRVVSNMTNSGTVISNTEDALKMFSCMALTATPEFLRNRFPGCAALFVWMYPPPAGHLADYSTLLAASKNLLLDRSATFTFIHLPIPHPPGVYDRSTATLTSGHSTYIDNLALADRCLSELRTVLEQSGQWDSSTILVMGDHSWRTSQIWTLIPTWSPEDQQASQGGRYDPRPAYLVKLPGQLTGAHIDTPYRSVNTRKLLDQIMAHNITTPAQLSAWAAAVQ